MWENLSIDETKEKIQKYHKLFNLSLFVFLFMIFTWWSIVLDEKSLALALEDGEGTLDFMRVLIIFKAGFIFGLYNSLKEGYRQVELKKSKQVKP